MERENNNNNVIAGQCLYVPAEKPYAVYAFVWEGPWTEIAQLIGTVIVREPDENGKMKLDGKPVYRMPDKQMTTFAHCFIPDDMGELYDDPTFIGFMGDIVTLEEVKKAKRVDLKDGDGEMTPARIIEVMTMTGLRVQLKGTYMEQVKCTIDTEWDNQFKEDDYVLYCKDLPINVRVWSCKDRSVTAETVLHKLWSQMAGWEEVDVTFGKLILPEKDNDYQQQVDELLELARIYGRYHDGENQLFHLLQVRRKLPGREVSYNEYIQTTMELSYNKYTRAVPRLQWAVDKGLAETDGDIIRFSDDFERMAAWSWKTLDNK